MQNFIAGSLGEVNYGEMFQIVFSGVLYNESLFSNYFLHLLLER